MVLSKEASFLLQDCIRECLQDPVKRLSFIRDYGSHVLNELSEMSFNISISRCSPEASGRLCIVDSAVLPTEVQIIDYQDLPY